MAGWDDVERWALAMPHVEESTWWRNRAWKVQGNTFVWARPLSTKDRADLGAHAPTGEILGVRVLDEEDKRAIMESVAAAFTIPHLAGFNAVLVALDDVQPDELQQMIVDAWLAVAPPALADQFLADSSTD